MSDKNTGASNEELLQQIEKLQAENDGLKKENQRILNSDLRVEKLNKGKVIYVIEEEENGDEFKVGYQFTRKKFTLPGFGDVTSEQIMNNLERYMPIIEKMITGNSRLLTEVSREAVEPDYEQYKGVTISAMKEALDKAEVKYDGSQKARAYYLPLYHEAQTGGEA